MDSKRDIPNCQRALQDAYTSEEVGELFDGARGVWPLLGTVYSKCVYAVSDLGVGMKETSVLAITSNEGKLPDDIIRLGVRETPDPEEYLYMDPPATKNKTGQH